MPRWCPGLPALSIVFFVQQEALTTAATLLGRDSESFESRRSEELLARGNVLDDKYFIPAIATISAFVLLSLVCLYFLGCCCNSRKMDEFHSGAAVPRHSAIRSMFSRLLFLMMMMIFIVSRFRILSTSYYDYGQLEFRRCL